ncbi:dehalogenase [Dehalococcoides sp. THU3]|uniref:dehalogenase n=1 Tax=Dehalococcoides TaxID=61434 RepID=UPI003218C848
MGLFYALLWIVPSIGVTLLIISLRRKNIALKWWEWLISAVALGLAILAVQHFYASVTIEFEYASAWLGGGLFLGLAIVLAFIIFRMVQGRLRKA